MVPERERVKMALFRLLRDYRILTLHFLLNVEGKFKGGRVTLLRF